MWNVILSDILINELRVTSYELRVHILRSCVYCTSYELRAIFIAWVTSYFLHTSYELLFITGVTSSSYGTSYELLFIARVTSYFLLLELRVTVYCTSYQLFFAYKFRVNLYMRVNSYFLTMSYNKDKEDKAVYHNKVMIKNYSLRLLFYKKLGAC